MRFFLPLLLISCAGQQLSYQISTGEILPIKIPVDPKAKIRLTCREQELSYFIKNSNLIFILAEGYIPRNTDYFCHILSKRFFTKETRVLINVTARDYGEESLTVAPGKVKLSPQNIKRVELENALTKELYRNYIREPLFDLPFVLPQAKITSVYGTARLFNRELAGYHTGVDFRKGTGEKIFSINRGKIVLAQNLFYLGNAVIIDHGLGIFSIYGHLSKIMVKSGNFVTKGELLGLAGSSGRVTGPHLHLGVMVNNVLVNGTEVSKLDDLW
jgi:murein DD-endopeptidase MepM/ murein hydrolase activator NlpD